MPSTSIFFSFISRGKVNTEPKLTVRSYTELIRWPSGAAGGFSSLVITSRKSPWDNPFGKVTSILSTSTVKSSRSTLTISSKRVCPKDETFKGVPYKGSQLFSSSTQRYQAVVIGSSTSCVLDRKSTRLNSSHVRI